MVGGGALGWNRRGELTCALLLATGCGLEDAPGAPYGAHAGVAWRFGFLRLGVGASASSEATWARPAWTGWMVLPTLALGFGPNVAPGQ